MGQKLCCFATSLPEKEKPKQPNVVHVTLVPEKNGGPAAPEGLTTLWDVLHGKDCSCDDGSIGEVKKVIANRMVGSSPDITSSEFYTPDVSFTTGKGKNKVVKMVDFDHLPGGDHDKDNTSSTNNKMKKKVRFDLPSEEAAADHIIIYYSPRRNYGLGNSTAGTKTGL